MMHEARSALKVRWAPEVMLVHLIVLVEPALFHQR
jgi:hypothetical protein